MKFSMIAAAALAIVPASAEVYFKEQFNTESWEDRWTVPTKWRKSSEMGGWIQTAGKWHGDATDKGIQTGEDARFYGLSAKMDKPFNSSDGKDLIIQYSVKHEQGIDCGGAYIKLLPGGDDFDKDSFGGESPYGVMFGPDICGANKRTHVILHSETKNENLLIDKDVPCETDVFSHLYTLIVRPDNTFEVFVDQKSVRAGKLEDEFKFLEPESIEDASVTKPDDWVESPNMPDPNSVKPDGYDDIPSEIADPEASAPDDWDEEDDGEWEAPMIDNPEYRGPWSPKMIPNPDYKGTWVQPEIPNPDYKYDEKMHAVCANGCSHLGFELWQVKAGTIFDDILITDSLEEAQKFAEDTFFKKKDAEKKCTMISKILVQVMMMMKMKMMRILRMSSKSHVFEKMSYRLRY
jgi:calreticulin